MIASPYQGAYHFIVESSVEHRADVTGSVFLLEEDVPFEHLFHLDTPLLAHHVGRCVRDDERVQRDRRVTKAPFDLLDRLVEADLWVLEWHVPDPLRIDERDPLLIGGKLPQ